MLIYLYDGTFEGLLTCIYEAYYFDQKPNQIKQEASYTPNLVDETLFIHTDKEKADKVYDSIKKKISKSALRNTYEVFLSEDADAGTIIYRYLKLGWKLGSKVDLNLIHADVMPVHQITQRVNREKHRMLGLVRFQLLENDLFYAPVEPDYNIVGLIAPHFANRMADQSWMIHDVSRGIAAICKNQKWILTEIQGEAIPQLDGEELQFQELWKTYFKHISIAERLNTKLQRSHMPARYWKHLIEKQKS